jgi:hypothetical protein
LLPHTTDSPEKGAKTLAIDRKHGILLTGLLLILLPFSYLFSENKNTKKETSPKSQFTFEASVNVVVVNATVTASMRMAKNRKLSALMR